MGNHVHKYKNSEIWRNYEKELNLNFKYFNVFWYDPNRSQDFDNYKKSFINIQFYKGFDIDSIINFFNNESSLEEWIVITPGSKGEEIISKLHENKSIKAFFVFCYKPENHEKWTKKYEKIKCLTNEFEVLTKNFIEINKDYLIPIFKYDEDRKKKIINVDYNFDNLKSNNIFALQSVKRENNDTLKSINKNQNKYNIFCMKTLRYLKEEKCTKDFEDSIKDENAVFYKYVDTIKLEDKERIKKMIKFVKNITLISLYFSKYPYLLNLFSYDEIEKMLPDEITPKNYIKLYNQSVYEISEILYGKLMKNEPILNEKEILRQLQIFAILFSFYGLHRKRDDFRAFIK